MFLTSEIPLCVKRICLCSDVNATKKPKTKENKLSALSVGGFSVVGESSMYSFLYIGLLLGWDIYKIKSAGFEHVMVLFIRTVFP